jgi:type II secretory pathway pseudopilin PulG
MKLNSRARSALTIVELMVTTVLIGVLGLVIFSILNTGTILGAKNSAVNTAHQEARIAMLQMTKNLHSAVSPLVLYDPSTPNTPAPADGLAPGILFQLWGGGPFGSRRMRMLGCIGQDRRYGCGAKSSPTLAYSDPQR